MLTMMLLLTGCASDAETVETTEPVMPVQLANPWVEYASMAEAEAAVGFSLETPETVAGTYRAEEFRVMSGQLLEVTYRDDSFKVVIRKMTGEGQDISGVYTAYEEGKTVAFDGGTLMVKYGAEDNSVLHLISGGGYSWSLYAPNGYWGDSSGEFLCWFGIQ